MAATGEFELRSAPSDGITAVRYSRRASNLLLAASWDKVRAHVCCGQLSCNVCQNVDARAHARD
jgi:hypothetical protein